MPKKKENFNYFNDLMQDTAGFEDVNLDTMAVPFIKILQELSPQCRKQKPEFIPSAEPGMLVNSVANELYPTPLRFVVGKFERYFTEWKPDRGGFVGQHTPELIERAFAAEKLERDQKGRLIAPSTGNILSDTYIYYVLLPDFLDSGVCVLNMSSTQLREAKKLNRMMTHMTIPGTKQKALPYFMIWSLDTHLTSNDQGEWFTPKITFEKFVTPDLLDNVVSERKELPNKTIDLALLDEDAGKETGVTENSTSKGSAKF